MQHIQQVVDGAFVPGQPAPPDAIVVCVGIGARTLGGVEDKDVHPIRGQTILIRAPWVKSGKTASSLDGRWTYVIPRRSGNVSRSHSLASVWCIERRSYLGYPWWDESHRLVGQG